MKAISDIALLEIRFYVSIFLSILYDFFLTWETDPQKSWAVLKNFNYWMTKKAIWQLGKNGVLVNFVMQELKFCKIAQLFFVPNSLIELRENKKHIIQTLAVSRRFVSENWLAMTTRHKLIMKNDPIWKQSKDCTRYNLIRRKKMQWFQWKENIKL